MIRKCSSIALDIAATNRALYTVFNLWNILFQLQKEIVSPWRGKADAWLNMPATTPSSYGLTSFQASELAFLLQTKHANTYSTLLLEEQRFWIVLHQIEMRSSIILNQVHSRFSAAGIAIGTSLTEEEVSEILGPNLIHILKQITGGIMEHVDANIGSLRMAYDDLRQAVQALYPKERVIRVHFEEAQVDTGAKHC